MISAQILPYQRPGTKLWSYRVIHFPQGPHAKIPYPEWLHQLCYFESHNIHSVCLWRYSGSTSRVLCQLYSSDNGPWKSSGEFPILTHVIMRVCRWHALLCHVSDSVWMRHFQTHALYRTTSCTELVILWDSVSFVKHNTPKLSGTLVADIEQAW